MASFSYEEAFSRNVGLLTEQQQSKLRNTRIAIPGVGGVGGIQAIALARLGVGHFTIADPDVYELSNFNRQMGATQSSLGQKKVEAMKRILLDINPTAEVTVFDQGINEQTIDPFLEGVDLVCDGLDFTCYQERFMLFRKARQKGLWVINCPPPGFGYSLLVFDPKGMTYEDYFDISPDMASDEILVSLLVGICPSSLGHRHYLSKDMSKFKMTSLPCASPAFFMIGGITAVEVFNLLFGRRKTYAVPWVFEFDALFQVYRKRYYPFGTKGLIQRLKKSMLRKIVARLRKKSNGAGR